MQKTVFVGMSGGVDSSVAAALLKEQGFKVVGVHLKCWNIDGCAAQDAEDARRAAETLQIPFYVFDFEQEYRDRVVQYMVDGYKKGITPNPDVMCNQEIKFGLFYKRAMELGADFVATGHYVKRVGDKLYAAKDNDKDQSYFLWTLKKNQIQRCLFPLGDLIKKTEVRHLAKKYKLPNAEKKDSQGICFLGQVSLPEFLGEFIPNRKGAIVNVAGEKVGEHQGAYYYTIGQRRGLGVGGSPVPLYISDKDVKKNTITVAPEGDEALLRKTVTLSDMSFTGARPSGKLLVRIRYRQPLFKAKMIGKKVVFDKPEKFVAPGQSAVLYDRKGGMLGGGIITSAA
jgi:tRNA-specific 2-thiouridylase